MIYIVVPQWGIMCECSTVSTRCRHSGRAFYFSAPCSVLTAVLAVLEQGRHMKHKIFFFFTLILLIVSGANWHKRARPLNMFMSSVDWGCEQNRLGKACCSGFYWEFHRDRWENVINNITYFVASSLYMSSKRELFRDNKVFFIVFSEDDRWSNLAFIWGITSFC